MVPSPSPRWLVKTEPSTYSFSDLERDGQAVWDGVTNPLALIHLRAMRAGDHVLVYHTGKERAIVGIAKVTKDPYPDPKAGDPKIVAVDLAPVGRLPVPVPLADLQADASLADWELLRLPRLSVLPVPPAARIPGTTAPSRRRRPSGGGAAEGRRR